MNAVDAIYLLFFKMHDHKYESMIKIENACNTKMARRVSMYFSLFFDLKAGFIECCNEKRKLKQTLRCLERTRCT